MKTAILLLAFTSIALGQGSLIPPGPPGLTMRSLDEIETRIPLNQTNTPGDTTCVFKITKAGSYILTGNIKPPAGKHGILIALLSPGVVETDMKGFTLDGSDAGATASGVTGSFTATDDLWQWRVSHGTIRNFGAGGDFPPVTAPGTVEFHDVRILGGGTGISTSARLLANNVTISGGAGTAIKMGSDSVLSGVEIRGSHAGIPKIIEGTGDHHVLGRVSLSWSFGASNPASVVLLGPNSRVSGLTARINGGTFSGPVFGNTSGFSEVSGLSVELQSVSAPTALSDWTGPRPGPDQIQMTYNEITHTVIALGDTGTHERIAARDCTFSQSVIDATFDYEAAGLGVIAVSHSVILSGTTTTPSVVRSLSAVHDDGEIYAAATASVTGPFIRVSGNGSVIRSRVSGIPSNGLGILVAGGNGNEVLGCRLIGANGAVNPTGVRIAAGVTNTLVRNLDVSGFPAAGPVVVDNLGGTSNIVAPILSTPGTIAGTVNPFASIVH